MELLWDCDELGDANEHVHTNSFGDDVKGINNEGLKVYILTLLENMFEV